MARALLGLSTLTALCACGGSRPEVESKPPQSPVTDWRSVVTEADRVKLRDWRKTWTDAVADVRNAGNGAEVAAAGVLLEPDAASGDPTLPPGNYSCSVTKVGRKSAGMLAFVRYPPFLCRVSPAGATISFEKIGGSQRPQGVLYRDNGTRLIFLGSMVLGDEKRALAYGRDAQRDLAGILERIGPSRWRLVFPAPAWESKLDVIDLKPVS